MGSKAMDAYAWYMTLDKTRGVDIPRPKDRHVLLTNNFDLFDPFLSWPVFPNFFALITPY